MKKTYSIFLFTIMLAAGCTKQSPATITTQSDKDTQQSQNMIVKNNLYGNILHIGSQKLFVQIVATPADMEQGLSDRLSMDDEQGMLFDFQGQRVTTPFWMPRMHFNLDIIWINNKKIIGITQNVPAPKSADDKLPYYYPPAPYDSAVEVNAGWTKKNNINVGDIVYLIEK